MVSALFVAKNIIVIIITSVVIVASMGVSLASFVELCLLLILLSFVAAQLDRSTFEDYIACAIPSCANKCPHGYRDNRRGCATCECVEPSDPCQGYYCQTGEECISVTGDRKPTCVVVSRACLFEPMCANDCPHGFQRDKDGCETCDCAEPSDPCQDYVCGRDKTCISVMGEPKASCVERSSPCSTTMCANKCPHGYRQDRRGCSTCECAEPSDPCQGYNCQTGKECVSVMGDRKPTCIVIRRDCARPMCATFCPHGLQRNEDGCETCDCAEPSDPCQDHVCQLGEACISVMGEPKASCVERATSCYTALCANKCPHGYQKNRKGCSTCECVKPSDPCQGYSCQTGEECVSVMGDRMPTCVVVNRACARPMCATYCPHGLQRNEDGCETCDCAEPSDTCQGNTCQRGEICISVMGKPKPSCVETTTPCPMPMCTNKCSRGYQKDRNGCINCECLERTEPCQNDDVCRRRNAKCISLRPEYKITCVAANSACATSMCATDCPHGYKRSRRGCHTCDCKEPSDPCQVFQCPRGKKCVSVMRSNTTKICEMEPKHVRLGPTTMLFRMRHNFRLRDKELRAFTEELKAHLHEKFQLDYLGRIHARLVYYDEVEIEFTVRTDESVILRLAQQIRADIFTFEFYEDLFTSIGPTLDLKVEGGGEEDGYGGPKRYPRLTASPKRPKALSRPYSVSARRSSGLRGVASLPSGRLLLGIGAVVIPACLCAFGLHAYFQQQGRRQRRAMANRAEHAPGMNVRM